MKALSILAAGCGLLVATSAASAAVIPYSDVRSFSATAAGATSGFVIPKFDSTLGTLTSVTVSISGSISPVLNAHNLAATAAQAYGRDTGTIAAKYNGTDLASQTFDAQTPGYPGYVALAAYTGNNMLDFTGPDAYSYTSTTTLPAVNVVFTAAGDLANFTGTGNAPLAAYGQASAGTGSSGGNVLGYIQSPASFKADVTYAYTPVPEPAALAVLALGATALLARRRG